VAEDFDGKPEAEFWVAAGNRVDPRCDCPGVRILRDLLVGVPDSMRICGVGILSWPLRAVASIPLSDFHGVSRAAGP
jgi:hypothetical protein